MSAMINGVRYEYYPGGVSGPFYEAGFKTEEERDKAKESLEEATELLGGMSGNNDNPIMINYHEYRQEKYGVLVPILPLGYGANRTDGLFPLGINKNGVEKLERIKVAQINQEGGKRRKSKRKSSKKSKRRKSSKRKRSKKSRRRR